MRLMMFLASSGMRFVVLAAEAAEEGKYGELVSLDGTVIIAQIINLFLTAFLVKKFLFKPVREVLEKRQALADVAIREAETARNEANSIKAEYEQNMLEAREKANDILANAQKTATAQSESILKEANDQAVAIKAKAEADIVQERRKAVNELKGEIGGMAMEIAGKVIERELSEKDHEKLIDEIIENVGDKL